MATRSLLTAIVAKANEVNVFSFDINQVAQPTLVLAGDIEVANVSGKALGLILPGTPDPITNFYGSSILFLRVCDEQKQITPMGIWRGWNSCEEFLSSIDQWLVRYEGVCLDLRVPILI